MHFVTGGAFNGKLDWVMNHYQLQKDTNDYVIHRCYKDTHVSSFSSNCELVILSGLEYHLQAYEKTDAGRITFQKELNKWMSWEQEDAKHHLVVIGSDISKGIVPIEKKERIWRDFVGWCYQDIVKQANRVDIIWYGISNTIKQ